MSGGIIMAGVPGNAWRTPGRAPALDDASGQHPWVRAIDTAETIMKAVDGVIQLFPGTAAEESANEPTIPPDRPRSSFGSESQFLAYQALRRNSMPENAGVKRPEDVIPPDSAPPSGHPAGFPVGYVPPNMNGTVRLTPWDDAEAFLRAVPTGSAADEEAMRLSTESPASPPPPGHPAGPPSHPSDSPPPGHPAGAPQPADSTPPRHTAGPGREMAP